MLHCGEEHLTRSNNLIPTIVEKATCQKVLSKSVRICTRKQLSALSLLEAGRHAWQASFLTGKEVVDRKNSA